MVFNDNLTPTPFQKRLESSKVRRKGDGHEKEEEVETQEDVLFFDTGGGYNSTVTKRAWHVFETTSHKQYLRGYGDKGEPKECQIVNACTKAFIPGRDLPVIFVVNYATLNEDEDEHESLVVPFELMRHGIAMDLTPATLGGSGEMYVEEEHIPFEWDEEKLYLRIEMPNEEDMEKLEIFELNSRIPDKALENSSARRKKKVKSPSGISLSEWQKRFAMLPEEVVKKTLENSTHFYLIIEAENQQDPRRHFRYQFLGLRLP